MAETEGTSWVKRVLAYRLKIGGYRIPSIMLVLLVIALGCCGVTGISVWNEDEAALEPVATATATVGPTWTPRPTRTPAPTATRTARPSPSPRPTATATTVPTDTPLPTETLVPVVATELPAAGIVLISLTSPIVPNSNASLVIQVAPGATCDPGVRYATCWSSAKGLEPKTAGDDGRLGWIWAVGPSTSPGEWTVRVTCDPGGSMDWPFVVQ